jgi:hypothetical protein
MIGLSWYNIYLYFVLWSGQAARSIMTMTSFKVMLKYFPIGSGFATYASHEAAVNYSPIYIMNGFLETHDLTLADGGVHSYFDDTFWPIVIGQTGFLGLLCYLVVIIVIIKMCSDVKYTDRYFYFACMFIAGYLLISTTAEPAFNNAVSMPLALMLGVCFGFVDKREEIRISE